MPFAHRLWLSVAWSDNAAANTILRDVGLDYIDAVLTGAQLYDPIENVGARAARAYGYAKDSPDALLDEGVWPGGSPLRPRISEFREAFNGDSPEQAATVRTLLCFATALDQGLVISSIDSAQMLSLMRLPEWATGARGARIPAIGLDGNPIIDADGPSYVDGVPSFVVGAFDEFVDDADVGLRVASRNRPFADAAAKLGVSQGKLADVAIVNVPTTDGRVLYWAVAFVANADPGGYEQFDLGTNQYGIALRDIVRQWMTP